MSWKIFSPSQSKSLLFHIRSQNQKPYLVFFAQFNTFSREERKVIYFQQQQAKKINRNLIIINYSTMFFHSFTLKEQIHTRFFAHITWYECSEIIKQKEFIEIFNHFHGQKKANEKIQKDSHQWKNSTSELLNFCREPNLFVLRQKLGYYNALSGNVVAGRRLGRRIGFPTLNLALESEYTMLAHGCYLTLTQFANQQLYFGLSCIFLKTRKNLYLETYLENFSQTVVHQKITVYLLRYYRPLQSFRTADELKNMITQDLKELKKKPQINLNLLF